MALNLDIRLRQQGSEEVSKAVKRLKADFDDASKAIDKSAARVAGFQRELKGIDRAMDTVDSAAFKRMDEDIERARLESQKLEKQQLETAKATERIAKASKGIVGGVSGGRGTPLSGAEARRRQAFDVTDPVGDVDTGIAAFAGAFGQFGGAGIEKAARGVSDVFAISEAAPRMVASLATISPAMLATIGGLGGVSLAFYAMNKAIDATADSARKAIKEIEQRLEAERKTREDLRSLSAEDAQQRIADLRQDIEATKAAASELDRLRDASREAGGEGFVDDFDQLKERAVRDISNLGEAFGINIGALGEYNSALDEQTAALAEQKAELDRLLAVERELQAIELGRSDADQFIEGLEAAGQQFIQTQRDIQELSSDQVREQLAAAQQRKTIAEQNRDATQAEMTRLRNLYDSSNEEDQSRILASLENLKLASAGYTAISDAESANIIRLTNDVQPLVEQREREAQAIERMTRLQELAASQAERAADALGKLTDAQSALADFEGNLATEELNKRREASINAVYDGMLKQIDAEIDAAKAAEKVAQAQQKLSDLESKRVEKLRDTNQEYYQEELGRLAAFRKDEARINDDFARDQRRRLEDLNDDLLEATANNDVVAFIQRQKEGSKELSRAAEDYGVDAVRRTEDFNAETARNQQEHLRDLLDINQQYHEQRLALQGQGAVAELSQIEQLQARRAEILAQRETSLEQFRQSLEQEALNRRRQSFIRQINAASEEYERLNQLATTSGAIIGSNFMRSIINGAMMTQIQQAQQAVQNVGNSIQFPSFAGGGISREPTLAMVGDTGPGWYEAHIPFKANQGLTMQDVLPYIRGGKDNPAPVVNFYGVTAESVKSEVINGVTEAIRRARATA